MRLANALIFPIAIYGCESWAMLNLDLKRIAAFEMWVYRRILRIPWTAKRTNDSIREELAITSNLVIRVEQHVLRYFGHISRRQGPNLEKAIMQGKVEGTKKRGQP